jgi:predicted CXXCH cytochrome family protein
MAGYDIGSSQLADYQVSVHGQALLERNDLGAPACNDCHGNHGAAPPGVGSLSAVCGTCHALEAELFNASPHRDAYAENDHPMCETCHSNHKILKPNDDMIGASESALCSNCHDADDGTKGLETATAIVSSIRSLAQEYQKAEQSLNEAQVRGMLTTDEEFRLKEVQQSLIQTRTLLHSFNMDSVESKAKAGIENAELVAVNSAALVDEYYFRRKGLGLATIFITILAIGLWVWIRRLD